MLVGRLRNGGHGGRGRKKRVLGTMPSLEAVPRARLNHMEENAPVEGRVLLHRIQASHWACRVNDEGKSGTFSSEASFSSLR